MLEKKVKCLIYHVWVFWTQEYWYLQNLSIILYFWSTISSRIPFLEAILLRIVFFFFTRMFKGLVTKSVILIMKTLKRRMILKSWKKCWRTLSLVSQSALPQNFECKLSEISTEVSVRRPSLPEVKNKQKEGAVPAS